jgi:hypothetical protein
MKYCIFCFVFFICSVAFAQSLPIETQTDSISDSLSIAADSSSNNKKVKVKKPKIVEDTLSYAEEYRLDKWRWVWGFRGGGNSTKLKTNESQLVRISPDGLPLLSNNLIVRDNVVNNSIRNIGYSFGVYARISRGSFFVQPEFIVSQRSGVFDITNSDGSLFKRINAKFNSYDIPLLFGIRNKNMRIFGGPTFNFAYKFNSDLASMLEVYSNDVIASEFFIRPNVNFVAGVNFELSKIFIDIRYEKGLNPYTKFNLGPNSNLSEFSFLADSYHASVGFKF